jgi:hypothetical protein
VRVKSVGDLTLTDCNFIRSGYDLYCNGGAGDTVASLMAVNTFFDTAGIGAYITPSTGCNIVRTSFINCWFSSQTGLGGCVLDSSGGGTIQGVTLVNPQVFLNTNDGIRIVGANTTDVDIHGGQGAGNGGAALQVGNNVTKWRVKGFVAGPCYGEAANGYGMYVGTGCSNYEVRGCRFFSNTTAQVVNGSEAVSTAIIDGNSGYLASFIAPTFTNSWTNLGSGTQSAGILKDADGYVTLRGVITGGTVGASAFSLPAGYAPPANESFAVNSNSAFGAVQVTSAGLVNILAPSTNTWVSLSGIRFRAG